MCNPIAAIGTIIKSGATASAMAGSAAAAANVAAATATLGQFASVASGAMGVASASQAHQAQKVQQATNQQNAQQAQKDEQRQLNIQEAQEDTAAAEQKLKTDLQTREAAARATVAGAESGAILNNNPIIQDIVRQGLVSNTSVNRNFENTVQGLREDRLGSRSKAQSRINSVSKPSSTATGLRIGQSVLGAAQDYSNY
jgi:mannitol-specific phosphotransferase system IIBC component